MTNYLVVSSRRVFVSMAAEEAEEAGVAPESKMHPHVMIRPLSLGAAEAISAEETPQRQTITMLCFGISKLGGDWDLYPTTIKTDWPALDDEDGLEGRQAVVRALLPQDVARIGGEIGKWLKIEEAEVGN
tara:strand:- start:2421 stop:2810 length:390 start_codon:yes stop_codon:yes gene_type:complete